MIRAICTDDYMTRKWDMRTSNCWTLVRDVWLEMTGLDLGDLTPAQTDNGSLHDAAWAATEGPRFVRLERPRQPSIVLMTRRREMPHVGVLLRWRILHMTPRGVRNPWWSDAVREWDHCDYYVPRDAPEAA